MPKPPLPTQEEMRTYCRTSSGALSNLSREWLKQRTTAAERIASVGYPQINRSMAEDWEARFPTLSTADQDAFWDWYITWYLTNLKRYDGRAEGDPDHEDPRYQLGGYVVNKWRDPTVCACTFQIMSQSPGAAPDVWMRTRTRCTAHSLEGQALRDTVHGESSRKSGALAIVGALINDETAKDRTTWSFSDDRLPGTDERVLELVVNGATNPQRTNVQAAADVQFGADSIRVT